MQSCCPRSWNSIFDAVPVNLAARLLLTALETNSGTFCTRSRSERLQAVPLQRRHELATPWRPQAAPHGGGVLASAWI